MTLVKISEAEREIMQIIWASGCSITSNEILDALPQEREWKITTVLTFLTRLAEKGLVTSTKQGKKNLYTSIVTEKEYKRFESRSFLQSIHGGSIKSFMASLADDELSPAEIVELKKWLSER